MLRYTPILPRSTGCVSPFRRTVPSNEVHDGDQSWRCGRAIKTMTVGTGNVSRPCRIAFAAMALASFALYATGVLALHQDRTSDWAVERSAMAAAVSYLAYGTHFGAVAINIEHYFL